jgi:predicted GNAT family acetyltransferase
MTQPSITREDGPERGRYVAKLDGIDAEAELVYSRRSPKLISADHTGVPDAFRGKGIGRLLVIRMVEDARAQGVRIVAQCPYVKAERQKHPEWADVFQD